MDDLPTQLGANTGSQEPLVFDCATSDDELGGEKNLQNTPARESFESSAAAPSPAKREASPYAHKLAHYADVFSTSVRTVKRWISIGRSSQPDPDLPPLDEPEKMAAWWSVHMRQRVPPEILALATAPSESDIADSSSAAASAPALTTPAHSASGKPPENHDLSYAAAVDRLRIAEAEAFDRYMAEAGAENPDPGRIEMRQRAWERLSESRRKVEKDASSVLEAAGEALPAARVREQLKEIHAMLAQGLRTFLRRVRPMVKGLPDSEADRIWDTETDALFATLQDNELSAG